MTADWNSTFLFPKFPFLSASSVSSRCISYHQAQAPGSLLSQSVSSALRWTQSSPEFVMAVVPVVVVVPEESPSSSPGRRLRLLSRFFFPFPSVFTLARRRAAPEPLLLPLLSPLSLFAPRPPEVEGLELTNN